MRLSEEQEEYIRKYVDGHDLKLKSLRDDIIDHICCVLENELEKNESFDEVFQDAVAELAPHGIFDLQNKTFYLLNSKRIKLMKKLTYLTGFIGSVSLTGGATFKLLHLPGANELFMIGYLIFLLVFIPLLAFDRLKVAIDTNRFDKWKLILGVISSVAMGLAGIFKVFHLQGADTLLMAGIIIFATGFLPFLFFNMYKRSVS
ncbi:MAG: hypothetical protein WBA74_16975 [Cyclobacteriaceae bacterium]